MGRSNLATAKKYSYILEPKPTVYSDKYTTTAGPPGTPFDAAGQHAAEHII